MTSENDGCHFSQTAILHSNNFGWGIALPLSSLKHCQNANQQHSGHQSKQTFSRLTLKWWRVCKLNFFNLVWRKGGRVDINLVIWNPILSTTYSYFPSLLKFHLPVYVIFTLDFKGVCNVLGLVRYLSICQNSD